MKKKNIRVMNKPLIWALSGALMLGSFNSCTDYDDDIQSLQNQIGDLANKLNSGKMIVSYKRNDAGNGYILTFQDGEKLEVKDGQNGANGTNGANGADGVNGINGKDGAPGANGVAGKDGINGTNGLNGLTPEISIREFDSNGTKTKVWHIRYRKADNTYDGAWRPMLADENKPKDDVTNMFVAQGPKGDTGATGGKGDQGSFAGTEQIKIDKADGNAVYLPLEWDKTGKVTKWSEKPAGYLSGSIIDVKLSDNAEFLAITVGEITYQVPMVANVMLYSLVAPASTVTVQMQYGYIVANTQFDGTPYVKDNVLTYGSYIPVIVNPVGANIANADFSFTLEDAAGNSLKDVIVFDEVTPGFENMDADNPGLIQTRSVSASDINGRWSLKIASTNLSKAKLQRVVANRPYALKATKKVDDKTSNTVLSQYAYKLDFKQVSGSSRIASRATQTIIIGSAENAEKVVSTQSDKALLQPSGVRVCESYITFKNKTDENKYKSAISNFDTKNNRILGDVIIAKVDASGDILTDKTIDFVFNYLDMTGQTLESDPSNSANKRYTNSTAAGIGFKVKFQKPLVDNVTIPYSLTLSKQTEDVYVSLATMRNLLIGDKKTQWETEFAAGNYLNSHTNIAGLPTGVTFGGYYKTDGAQAQAAINATEVQFLKFTVDASLAKAKRIADGGTQSLINFSYLFSAAGNPMNNIIVDLTLKVKDTPYEKITRTEKEDYVRNYGKSETVMIQSLYTEANPQSSDYNMSLFNNYTFKWTYTNAAGTAVTDTKPSATAQMTFATVATNTAPNMTFFGDNPAKAYDRTHAIEVWYAPFGNVQNGYQLSGSEGSYKFTALSQLADGNAKLGTGPSLIVVNNKFDNNGGAIVLSKSFVEAKDYFGAKYDIFSDTRVRSVSIDFADNATPEQKSFIETGVNNALFKTNTIKPSAYAINSMQTLSVTIPMKVIITDVFGITREWSYPIVITRKN